MDVSGLNPKKSAELEALLFHYGEPITVKKIAKLLKIKEVECGKLLDGLEQELKQNSARGLMLLRQETRVQLVTKPDLKNINESLIREEFREELSPASLETLSIIAYLGPIPRLMIDYVRGVNSSFILRGLLMRGLIERETDPKKKNVYEYRVSFNFLGHIGLSKQEELPEYEKYKDILQRFEVSSSE
ncbi:MAG: SMC-Scp complex subunit ScpB [Patescibacteria group bacterium]|nr:SMC-Scp complex subunit ScpB [Patescibacteria group bacterium]